MRETSPGVGNVPTRVTVLRRLTVFRLKSWMPAAVKGESAITIVAKALPHTVGATQADEWRTLCLGPADWLVMSDALDAEGLRQRMESDCARQGIALTDLSDTLAVVRVQGACARELLSKGCGLDLHPRFFPAGQSARTCFASLPVTLDCIDDSPCMDLYVSRSYLNYLHAWLLDAAAEFEVRPDVSL